MLHERIKHMKTIGLIGGMSWESTITYYQIINETIKKKLGGLHSAKILLYSVDFDEIEKCQSSGNWEEAGKILTGIAKKLELAGADCIVICTNTMHKIAPQMQQEIAIPILHIADTTICRLKKAKINKVGLLGTKYTMEEAFYKERLLKQGIDVIIPDKENVDIVNDIIFNELCLGIIKDASRKKFAAIIQSLKNQGAQGVILGCTEIGLLIQQKDSVLPAFDTTIIHAASAAEYALK